MRYEPQNTGSVPADTAQVARKAFPKGNVYMTMRDEMGLLYQDERFAALFSHRGQPGISPGNLALVMVMQYAEGLTDGQAAQAVASRIDWKYALGLPLANAGFDASVLSEFRDRLLKGGEEHLLLDEMLSLFMSRGWLKGGGEQRTDATHVLAAIRELNRLEMVGETLRRALEALAVVAPSWLQGQVPLDWYDRYGARFEQYRLPSKKNEKEALAEQIGQDGLQLLSWIYDPSAPVYLVQVEAVQLLRQVWVQQYYLNEGECQWRPAKWLPPAKRLIISPNDVEARYGKKRDVRWQGYKVHLTETCEANRPNLVTHVLTTTAPVADVEVTETIQRTLVKKGLAPKTHYVDQGYVDADILVKAAAQGIDLLGPAPQDTSAQGRAGKGFAATDFQVDWQKQQVMCPAGKVSQLWRQERNRGGYEWIRVRFAQGDCDQCASRPLCTQAQQGRTIGRRPQPQHEALQAARAYQQTDEFKQRYRCRAGVEGTISQSTRSFHMRQTRYRGLAKTHLQHVLIAAAMNLTRMSKWLQGKNQEAKTRHTHFHRLGASLASS